MRDSIDGKTMAGVAGVILLILILVATIRCNKDASGIGPTVPGPHHTGPQQSPMGGAGPTLPGGAPLPGRGGQ